MFLSVSQKSKEERELKNGLEIVKREKQEEHSKYEELLMKKDEELKKSNTLCKSLEKLMNEKSAAEKEVREKVTDKDVQLKVEMFICSKTRSCLVGFTNNLSLGVEIRRNSGSDKN
jgi:DNA gyrase/topoisomerase IV subunit B